MIFVLGYCTYITVLGVAPINVRYKAELLPRGTVVNKIDNVQIKKPSTLTLMAFNNLSKKLNQRNIKTGQLYKLIQPRFYICLFNFP